jgi:hypothetical protein
MEKKFIVDALLGALKLSFDGEDGDDWFDGLNTTLEGLNIETVSRTPAPGRSSIAAHVRHLVYSLETVNARFSGEHPELDWTAAWAQPTVTMDEWMGLCSSLAMQRRALEMNIKERAEPNQVFLERAINSIVHLGYHVGAIRQLLLVVQ